MMNLFSKQEAAEQPPPPPGWQLTQEHFDAAEPYPNGVMMLRVAQEQEWSVKQMLVWRRAVERASEKPETRKG